MPAIELQSVFAAYREVDVLHDVTLAVAAGEWLALVGPNGAGKSTVLRVITGLLKPRAGMVRLGKRELREIRPAERARWVAVVPQELSVPLPFTVGELVALGRTNVRQRWARLAADDRRAIERAMAYTDVLELRERPFEELSGGEKQRAALALALAQETQILLLDEPTAHLDLNHQWEFFQLLERLNRECQLTVVMTSHDLNLAAEFCARLALFDHGRLAAIGTPSDVLHEDLLRETYHCDVRVRQESGRAPQVQPERQPRIAPPGVASRVHVLAGGGSGAELLRRLVLTGHHASCGPLNMGDSDAQAATALDVPAALEKPFSSLGTEALVAARKISADADVLVLTEVPFGPGNLALLTLAGEALDRGTRVLINTRNLEQRDFTPQREAQPRLRALLTRGAVGWQHADEVFQALEKS
ncbi:MAG: ABC transporter ATP-binding protein [Verrucomicrobia bacterium]|nr:MAG: ABC transporter ATP-binding protein [Verrucomicrobiota bacterium]